MNNQTLEELNNRNLDKCYFSISFFPTKIYFNDGNSNINIKTIYIIYGCNINGVRKYITSIIESEVEKTSDWYDLFMILKNRNIETILYALIPDNDLLKQALKIAFPNIIIFPSWIDVLNTVSKYYSFSYSSKIITVIKNIYISQTIEESNMALNDFKQTFSNALFVLDILDKDFKKVRSIYSYDYDIRKLVYSYYFSRDTVRLLKKISNYKTSFSSINEFIEYLIPSIIKHEKIMFAPKITWSNVLNKIYLDNKDLISRYL